MFSDFENIIMLKKVYVKGGRSTTSWPKKLTKVKEPSTKGRSVKRLYKSIFWRWRRNYLVVCKNGIIKQPKYCNKCRGRTGKTSTFRLIKREAKIDKYIWRCKDKDCRSIETIRKGSKLLETFPKIKLKFLLIFIFTHFCFLVPPDTSSKTLKLSLATIRKISNLLSEWIVGYQRIE